MKDLEEFFSRSSRIIDESLNELIPAAETEPKRLYEAVRWSVFAGGKRFRPALCLAVGQIFDVSDKKLLRTASATSRFAPPPASSRARSCETTEAKARESRATESLPWNTSASSPLPSAIRAAASASLVRRSAICISLREAGLGSSIPLVEIQE